MASCGARAARNPLDSKLQVCAWKLNRMTFGGFVLFINIQYLHCSFYLPLRWPSLASCGARVAWNPVDSRPQVCVRTVERVAFGAASLFLRSWISGPFVSRVVALAASGILRGTHGGGAHDSQLQRCAWRLSRITFGVAFLFVGLAMIVLVVLLAGVWATNGICLERAFCVARSAPGCKFAVGHCVGLHSRR